MNRNHKKIFVWRLCLFGVIACIFILSNQQGEESHAFSDYIASLLLITETGTCSPDTVPLFAGLSLRNYAHVLMYFVLGIFVFLSLKDGKWVWTRPFRALGICYVCGCIDEFHQMFIPGRSAKIQDTFIDCVGFVPAVGVSFVIWMLMKRYRR